MMTWRECPFCGGGVERWDVATLPNGTTVVAEECTEDELRELSTGGTAVLDWHDAACPTCRGRGTVDVEVFRGIPVLNAPKEA